MSYKLIDYDFTTEADLARLILDYKGIEYESVRLSKANASEAEANAPFGKLPILEEDGEVTVGGPVLPSYLAMKHDFAGLDFKQKGKCATIIVGLREMFVKFRQEDMMKLTQEEKVVIWKKLLEEDVPVYLDHFEKLLKKNEANGVFVGDQVTYCDFGVAITFHAISRRMPTLLDNHPLLKAHMEKIMAIPTVSEHAKKREQNK